MKNVLMTGAAGGVAGMLRPLLSGVYDHVRLSDLAEIGNLAAHESSQAADLTDLAAVESLCDGIDGIIHLGGFSVEGPWEVIHPANIVGCHNLFEAARRKGVKRVIFASSNHAIGFYRRDRRINTEMRVRPDGYYGVSKAFGEAMGSLYADKHNVGCLSIRIGNVDYKPADHRRLSIWLHPEDLMQLIRIGLEHPDMHCEIVYGASGNERSWWDNQTARRLGYRPKWKAEDFVDHAMAEQAKLDDDPVGDNFQGGGFCSIGFDGRIEKI